MPAGKRFKLENRNECPRIARTWRSQNLHLRQLKLNSRETIVSGGSSVALRKQYPSSRNVLWYQTFAVSGNFELSLYPDIFSSLEVSNIEENSSQWNDKIAWFSPKKIKLIVPSGSLVRSRPPNLFHSDAGAGSKFISRSLVTPLWSLNRSPTVPIFQHWKRHRGFLNILCEGKSTQQNQTFWYGSAMKNQLAARKFIRNTLLNNHVGSIFSAPQNITLSHLNLLYVNLLRYKNEKSMTTVVINDLSTVTELNNQDAIRVSREKVILQRSELSTVVLSKVAALRLIGWKCLR